MTNSKFNNLLTIYGERDTEEKLQGEQRKRKEMKVRKGLEGRKKKMREEGRRQRSEKQG